MGTADIDFNTASGNLGKVADHFQLVLTIRGVGQRLGDGLFRVVDGVSREGQKRVGVQNIGLHGQELGALLCQNAGLINNQCLDVRELFNASCSIEKRPVTGG